MLVKALGKQKVIDINIIDILSASKVNNNDKDDIEEEAYKVDFAGILDVIYNTRDLTSGALRRIAAFTEGAKKLDNIKISLAVFTKIATFAQSISNIVKDSSIDALVTIGKYLSIKIYKALDMLRNRAE